MKSIKWSKDVFGKQFKFHLADKTVAQLNNNLFTQNATGVFDDESYQFKFKSYLKQEIAIINLATNKQAGTIKINCWRAQASIVLNGKTYTWKFNNWWRTKWSIFTANDKKLEASTNTCHTKGEIASDSLLLSLTGVFINNYIRQVAVLTSSILPSMVLIGLN